MVADVPQNVKDLAVMGMAMGRHVTHPEEELPDVNPRRIASSAILNAAKPLYGETPTDPLRRFAYTTGELGTMGLLSGGAGTGRGMLYNAALPAVGGATGEMAAHRYGFSPTWGKIGGSLLFPGAVAAGEYLGKLAIRGPLTPDKLENIKTMEAGGAEPTTANMGPWPATVQNMSQKTPAGWFWGRRAADKQAEQMAAKAGSAAPVKDVTAADAGSVVAAGLNNWRDSFDRSYQALRQFTASVFPDSTPVKVDRLTQTLDDLTTPAAGAETSTGQVPELLQSIKADVAKSGGVLPAGTIKALKTKVGAVVYPTRATIADPAEAQYKAVYEAMAQDLENGAQAVGEGAYKAMKAENIWYATERAKFTNYFDSLIRKAGVEPVDTFNAIMTGGKKGAEQARAVMGRLSQNERDVYASAAIESMGWVRKPGERAFFSPTEFVNKWDSIDAGAKEAIFGRTSNPNMIKDLDTVARAANVVRETSKVMPNPSGTAPAGVALVTPFALWFAPVATASITAGSSAVSYALTNPGFVHWLATSTKLPAGMFSSQLVLLNNMAQKDPRLQPVADAYNQAVREGQPGTGRSASGLIHRGTGKNLQETRMQNAPIPYMELTSAQPQNVDELLRSIRPPVGAY
jgi:hypothetical protein